MTVSADSHLARSRPWRAFHMSHPSPVNYSLVHLAASKETSFASAPGGWQAGRNGSPSEARAAAIPAPSLRRAQLATSARCCKEPRPAGFEVPRRAGLSRAFTRSMALLHGKSSGIKLEKPPEWPPQQRLRARPGVPRRLTPYEYSVLRTYVVKSSRGLSGDACFRVHSKLGRIRLGLVLTTPYLPESCSPA